MACQHIRGTAHNTKVSNWSTQSRATVCATSTFWVDAEHVRRASDAEPGSACPARARVCRVEWLNGWARAVSTSRWRASLGASGTPSSPEQVRLSGVSTAAH